MLECDDLDVLVVVVLSDLVECLWWCDDDVVEVVVDFSLGDVFVTIDTTPLLRSLSGTISID